MCKVHIESSVCLCKTFKNEIRSENVTYYTGTGNRGSHDTVWRSSEAVDYQEQVKNIFEINKELIVLKASEYADSDAA